ncbi:oxysterol-binding protein 2-like [Physella acuta]|uniref:oxysterol-binding protein 2-like n=1 Tax=Physella acuta TaxID=109671 RepID=UPI0027DB9B72|nr:oxysterol-binding protein 2-like [Physella acuta]
MATINLFQDLISTQVHALNKTLSDLESAPYPWVAVIILKSVKDRAALLKITYSSWLNAIEKFPLMTQCERWQQMLLREQKQRIELEELVKQLPKDSQMKAQITDRGQPTKYTGSYSRESSPDEEEKSDVELLNKSRLANTKKVERDRRLDERTSLNDHQPKIKSKSTYATEPRLERPTEDKSRSPRTDNQNSRTVREKCCMEIAQQCPNCGHILTCFHTKTPQDETAYDTFDDNES